MAAALIVAGATVVVVCTALVSLPVAGIVAGTFVLAAGVDLSGRSGQ